MQQFRDYEGRSVRLTDERPAHILEHPEMARLEGALEETLSRPQEVVEPPTDPQTYLYYRRYTGTRVGDKYLCVVVKMAVEDPFIITAYLTDKIKRGARLWTRRG